MHIYIPSRGRADRIVAHKFVPSDWPLTVVVPKKETRQYRKNHPSLDIISCPVEGISAKRQWIMENSEDDIVVFVDDDLVGVTDESPLVLNFSSSGVWPLKLSPPFPYLESICEVTVV